MNTKRNLKKLDFQEWIIFEDEEVSIRIKEQNAKINQLETSSTTHHSQKENEDIIKNYQMGGDNYQKLKMKLEGDKDNLTERISEIEKPLIFEIKELWGKGLYEQFWTHQVIK